jgi:membrane protease YdiL (CAAX protease family)
VYPLFTIASAVTGQPIAAFPWMMVIAALLAHALLLEWIAPAPWSSAALGAVSWSPRQLGRGVAIGAALVALTLPIGLLVGHFVLEPTGGSVGEFWRVAGRLALLLAPAALFEELVFRGYLLSATRELIGTRGAVVATSAAFAAIHITNPGASALPILVVFAAGIALALVRLATDSVPAAWTAHLGWNWMLAAGLHAEVSGLAFETPAWQLVEHGPDWLTGGTWGPEGGAYALVAFALLSWSIARRVIPPAAAAPVPARALMADLSSP